MSLKEQIEEVVPKGALVGETHYTEAVTGRDMTTYSVNTGGVVLQYVIPSNVEDPGEIEDFLYHIKVTTKEVTV